MSPSSRSGARVAAANSQAISQLSGLEETQNGEHPPVVLAARGKAELAEDRGDVLLDGALGDHQLLGDRRIGAALRHQAEHLSLAGRELLERVFLASATHE